MGQSMVSMMRAAAAPALLSVLCAVTTSAAEDQVGQAAPSAQVEQAPAPAVDTAPKAVVPPPSISALAAQAAAPSPQNSVFYDHPLMLRQYGYGVLAGSLAGALGFYIGNAFEGAIFGSDAHKGYLSFTGIRYEHKRGPFWGGGAGMLFGSSLAVFFVGESDEEPGSVLLTVAGGALTTAAAVMLADAAGVQKDRGMLAFAPLIALPPIGAVGGYHVSRWFYDRKRRSVTESAQADGPALHAPRFGFVPGAAGESGWRLDALNLTF
ncbi:MAG TPA: hypothetical protein VHO02_01650 [Fibrobacteria bacterium]|nr:hypothetical protein [Fibrobacteria bacterium]